MCRVRPRDLWFFALLSGLILAWLPARVGADDGDRATVPTGDLRPRVALRSHEWSATRCAGEPAWVPLVLENTGTQPWSEATKDRVSYHVEREDGSLVVRDGLRTVLPHEVAPGAVVSLKARFLAPTEPGAYRVRFAVVREGVAWSRRTEALPLEVGEVAFRWRLEGSEGLVLDGAAVAEDGARVAEVRIHNDGCAVLDPGVGDRLTYRIYTPEGEVVQAEGPRAPLRDVIAPNESATVPVPWPWVLAPGRYVLAWELVREGLAWVGPPSNEDASVELLVTERPLAWSLDRADFAARFAGGLAAGDRVALPVRVRNLGTAVMSTSTHDALSYRFVPLGPEGDPGAPAREGERTPFRESVAPGEVAEFDVAVTAPDRPGRYRFELEPVRDGTSWYGAPTEGEASFLVDVGPPALAWEVVSLETPRFLWRGRLETLSLRVRNVGVRAWSPETEDHLTYRFVDAEGRSRVADGLRTSLPGVVPPGGEVEVSLRVRGPPTTGPVTLVIEPVREHVRMFGPPANAASARVAVWVESPGRFASIVYVLAYVGLIGWAIRRRRIASIRVAHDRPETTAERWMAAGLGALVVWGGFVVTGLVFADEAGLEAPRGADAITVSMAALLAVPAVFVPSRGGLVRLLAPCGLAVVSLLVFADLSHLEFFGTIVPFEALFDAQHVGDIGESVADLARPAWGMLAVPPVVAGAWALLGAAPRSERKVRLGVALGLVLVAVPAIVALVSAGTGDRGRRLFSLEQNAARLGIFAAHTLDLGRVLRTLTTHTRLSDAEVAELRAAYAAKHVPLPQDPANSVRHAAPGGTDAAPWNLVLVQVESLETWVIGAEVAGGPVMPFLRAFSAEALYFSQIFDQTAEGRTSDAEYLALASNHPYRRGALCFLAQDRRFVTLATTLAERGYHTLSAHPYEPGFWNRKVMHPRYGFVRSLFRPELGEGPVVGWGLADGVFFDRMLVELRAAPEPFFAFLITLSLHHPYAAFPSALKGIDVGEFEGTRLGNYLLAMNYFDRSLAAFVRGLADANLLDRTVLALYGDHDSRLLRDPAVLPLVGEATRDGSFEARHERVPVFVRVPKGALHGEVTRVGGQIDIGPTLLEVLQVPRPGSFFGRSLRVDEPAITALPDGSAVTEDRIFVRRGGGTGADGRCFAYPTGRSRPRSDCEAMQRVAAADLEASRRALRADLLVELAGR